MNAVVGDVKKQSAEAEIHLNPGTHLKVIVKPVDECWVHAVVFRRCAISILRQVKLETEHAEMKMSRFPRGLLSYFIGMPIGVAVRVRVAMMMAMRMRDTLWLMVIVSFLTIAVRVPNNRWRHATQKHRG